MSSPLTREWALKWLKGSIESYILGRTSLDIVKGRIRRAIESYGVIPKEIVAVVDSLLTDPSLNVPRELKEGKVKPLAEFIKSLEGGGRDG